MKVETGFYAMWLLDFRKFLDCTRVMGLMFCFCEPDNEPSDSVKCREFLE
jgi:hypothetical protein